MRFPRGLGIIIITCMAVMLTVRMLKSSNKPSVFDVPKKLQDTKQSLTVWLHTYTNGCDVYSISKSGDEDDRLYLEPATNYLAITPDFFKKIKDSNYTLKIYGSFYKGKGIPLRFLGLQPTPKRYSVFRYESLDIEKQ